MNKYDQYRSPQWRKRRDEIEAQRNHVCESCGDADNPTLHIHHINYTHGRDLWDYDDNNFLCLCDTCHAEIHRLISIARVAISNAVTEGCNPWRGSSVWALEKIISACAFHGVQFKGLDLVKVQQ